MTSLMPTLQRGIATAFAIAVLFTLGTALEAAADCPVPSMTKPSTAPDLVVSNETCKVGMGTYYYASVNILKGGVLWFQDEKDVHFWAKAIIIENGGSVLAGTDQDGNLHPGSTPIGTNGGVVTIHLWGAGPTNPTDSVTGARCKSDNGAVPPDPPCGIDRTIWESNGSKKVDIPVANSACNQPPCKVNDYFYQYSSLPKDDADPNAFFGTKVLALSYGGTLKLFGAKGASYGTIPATSSGTSWARLGGTDGTLAKKATTLVVDREVDWLSKDGVKNQIVVTTTDYLPGHSELLEIQTVGSDRKTISFKNIEPQCDDGGGGVCWIHNGKVYDLAAKGVPARLGLDYTTVETRAAVALLTRSIRIVSGGDNVGDEFPVPPPLTSTESGYFFGGHTIVRQGFRDFQVQGVEFYQLGQGGRLGHYPVHFHVARKTSADPITHTPRAFLKDSSVHDSMTRWVTIHGTQDILVARNVGFKSIGHGYYLEDGTEINNQFRANIGIYARAAVKMNDDTGQRDNPRKVPGILAAPFQPAQRDNVPFYTDYNRPAVFWIMNGWNDFEDNMAVGAGTCGMCYWLVPGGISGHSLDQKWESYASLQRAAKGKLSTTPLKTFQRNACSTAMMSFNTVGNSGTCNGLGTSDPGDVFFKRVANDLAPAVPDPPPNPICDSPNDGPDCKRALWPNYYPKVDSGGGRFATTCDKNTPLAKPTGPNPDDVDCTDVGKCGNANKDTNCQMTVLDRYTSAFHWAEQNFGAIWLRPQWFVVLNTALSDVQAGGLGFVSGGDYTKSSSPEGNLMLVRKSVFIGNTQGNAANPLASNAGPFVPGGLKCDNKPSTINYCLSKAEGITMQLVSFAANQRLFTIYDGPAHQDSNAYLDITETTVNKCNQGQGNCQNSDFMYGRTAGILWDPVKKACYLPNAAIAWKQPNGFYYPPSFHSRNLFFNNVDIRHLVVEPLFNPGTREQDDDAVRAAYCTFVTDPFFGMFGASFSAVDRQTILNDDDGSLTAYRHTISVNTDEFFTAPVETTECRSGTLNLLGHTKPRTATVTGTAKTSPYEYVTTAVYPACAATGCGPRMCTADTMNTADCCINNSEDPPKCTIPVKFNQSCQGGSKCFSLWSVDCANQSCFGVPLYRQLVTRAEKAEIDKDKHDITKRPSIQMAAMSIFQRSNLTANNGTYYIDTTPSIKQQVAVRPPSSPIVNLNVFEKNKTYYVYQIFAKDHTRTSYQIYVGGGFDKNNDNQLWAITTPLRNTPLDFPKTNWPVSWERRYGPNDPCVPPRANCPKLPHGVLEVTVDMHEFAQSFADAKPANCGPASFCKWNENWTATPNKCRCTSSDPVLLKECQEKFIDPNTGKEVYDDVVCAWGVADIDCPVPGCYGFAVTLTDDFDIGQRTPPDVNLFPQDKNWNVPLKLGPSDLLGDCPTTSLGSGACVVEASFASLECRSDALALRLQGATDLGRTKDRLVRQAAKLDERLRDAEAQMVAGDARKARIRLKNARRVLIAIGFRLRSLTGRRQIAAATRDELQTTIAGLDTDLRALRGTF